MSHKHTRHHKPRLETLASSDLGDPVGSHGGVRMRGRDQRRELEIEAEVLGRLRDVKRAGGVVNEAVLVEVLAEFPPDDGERLTRLRMRLLR